MARLSRLIGRGRALEILLVADDCDAASAEQYGCVNRAITDVELDSAVDAIAARLARFERETLARTKAFVDQVTLPNDAEMSPAFADYWDSLGRPAR